MWSSAWWLPPQSRGHGVNVSWAPARDWCWDMIGRRSDVTSWPLHGHVSGPGPSPAGVLPVGRHRAGPVLDGPLLLRHRQRAAAAAAATLTVPGATLCTYTHTDAHTHTHTHTHTARWNIHTYIHIQQGDTHRWPVRWPVCFWLFLRRHEKQKLFSSLLNKVRTNLSRLKTTNPRNSQTTRAAAAILLAETSRQLLLSRSCSSTVQHALSVSTARRRRRRRRRKKSPLQPQRRAVLTTAIWCASDRSKVTLRWAKRRLEDAQKPPPPHPLCWAPTGDARRPCPPPTFSH